MIHADSANQTPATAVQPGPGTPQHYSQALRDSIASLSYLPTSVSVAMRLFELGKDPTSGAGDYAEVLQADNSLSTKLLALANSPWFGVRNHVTNLRMAIQLMGLGTVRTVAISNCLAGLHNELRLGRDESKRFWASSLQRGVAARQWCRLRHDSLEDEAFLAGMFQDIAMVVMYACAKRSALAIWNDPTVDVAAQLAREKSLFGMDHAEAGGLLAEQLELPELFTGLIIGHHRPDYLKERIEEPVMIEAMYAASAFPPLLESWNPSDARQLCEWLASQECLKGGRPTDYFSAVEREYARLRQYFERGTSGAGRLARLMARAACEAADSTSLLIKTANELMRETASIGVEFNQLVRSNSELANQANHDPLTGLLNRHGFISQAERILAAAAKGQEEVVLLYMDLDSFKPINDELGHEFGDRMLCKVAGCITDALRQQDIVGRIGGDEFVALLDACTGEQGQAVADRIVRRAARLFVQRGEKRMKVSISVGLVSFVPSARSPGLDDLLAIADKQMYEAKQSGGGRIAQVRLG